MMSSTQDTELEYSSKVPSDPANIDAAPGGEPEATDTPRKPRVSKRIPKSDSVLEAAVDRARRGVLEVAPEPQVGRHVSATIDGERLVTHRFEAFVPGYSGWQWYATLARVSRSKEVTVCEVGLLPSGTALLAPEWLPWSQRVRPEDSQPDEETARTETAPDEVQAVPDDVPAEPGAGVEAGADDDLAGQPDAG